MHETPEAYAAVTLPYINSIPPARIQWVYNVLERKVLKHLSVSRILPTLRMTAAGAIQAFVCCDTGAMPIWCDCAFSTTL